MMLVYASGKSMHVCDGATELRVFTVVAICAV